MGMPPDSELETFTYEDFGVGIRWLAEQLEGHPRGLRAGDVVITGGLTRAMPLEGMARARAGAAEVCVTR